jgi:zinc protease
MNSKIETPDKQNANFMVRMPLQITDKDPDYAALQIAGLIFGGGANSRLFTRIRVKDGLSYGAGANFSIPIQEDSGTLSGYAIAAPQNMPKVEADFNDELARVLKDGFTADEVTKAQKTWLDARAQDRTNDAQLVGQLATSERWGRTLDWDAKVETAVAALTPQQVTDAFKRRVDPAAISIVKGGDFKKAGVYQ